jgi:hypothetical protein
VVINGNSGVTDAGTGLYLSIEPVTDYSNIGQLSVSGNSFKLAAGDGYTMIVLHGVAGGNVTGNSFDCGGAGEASPKGRFVTASYAKDIIFSGNQVSGINTTNEGFITGTGVSNILMLPEQNSGITLGNGATWYATSAELASVTHIINTVGKYIGRRVWNGTTGKWVYATGSAAADVWNDAVGALAHTPI